MANRSAGYIFFKLLLLMLVAAAIYLFVKAAPPVRSITDKVLGGRKGKAESSAVGKGEITNEKLSGKGVVFEPSGDRMPPKRRAKVYYPEGF